LRREIGRLRAVVAAECGGAQRAESGRSDDTAVLEAAGMALLTVAADGGVRSANRVANRLLDIDGRLVGQKFREILVGRLADDRLRVQFERTLAHLASGTVSCPVVAANGQRQSVVWRVAPWLAAASEAGGAVICGLAVDPPDQMAPGAAHEDDLAQPGAPSRARADAPGSERLAEPDFLQTFLDNVPDHIYFKDRQSRFLRINKALATHLGLARAELAQGKSDRDYFSSEHAEQALADEQEILRTGQPMVYREEKETWPDGHETWVTTTKLPLRDQQGTILGTFGVSRDVTDRVRAAQQLRELTEQLQRSNEDLSHFAHVASHDLQEPLRVVAAYCQLLQRRYTGRLDRDADEFLEFVVRGTERMQNLVRDLLNYSRVDCGPLARGEVDLGEAFDAALANLQLALREARGQVTRSELPVVRADHGQMIQLLQNLIGNGLKFRGPRPARIHVQAGRESSAWRLEVRDNGIGIDARDAEKVFHIFQRLHSRDDYPGCGIGLATCQRIVQRHGGRIWLESTPGEGTTVCFTLPE